MQDAFYVAVAFLVFLVAGSFAAGARSCAGRTKVIDYIWTGGVSLLLLVYLVYALLRPERF